MRRNESGQATIEFAIMIIMVLGFSFFYLQLAAFFSYGNFVHYATFMSARSYMSGALTQDEQKRNAEDVLISMLKVRGTEGLDRFRGIAQSFGGSASVGGAEVGDGPGRAQSSVDKDFSWQEGVRYDFRSKLFMLSLGSDGTRNAISLTSESWLGRHPSYNECLQFMESKGIFDNGC